MAGKKFMEGRMKLKDATTLAQLVELLEPFEGGRSPPGVRAFRGVEAAMGLNHLHRLRHDPLKDDAQARALERQMRSFAQKFEEDVEMLSPKNIAWALNALKGMEGYKSVFEASAQRLCEIPPGGQWSIIGTTLICNAFAHGSDGLGKHDGGDISVPEHIVPHLSRVVQQLLLVAAVDSLTERGGGGAAAACSPPTSATPFATPHTPTHVELPNQLRHLSIIANAFSKLHAHDDDLFDSVSLAARRAAKCYCEHGAPFYLPLQDVARTLNAFAHSQRLDASRLAQSKGLFEEFFTVLRVSLSHLRVLRSSSAAGAQGHDHQHACGPGCSYVSSTKDHRQVHGCVPANLGIIANAMARVGLYHAPTILAILDAVERLAVSHANHFDVQAVVNIAHAVAQLEEKARERGGDDGQEASQRMKLAAPRVFAALSQVVHALVEQSSVSLGKHLSIESVTTMLQSSSKLGVYQEELFNLMIQGGLESMAGDTSEVKDHQAEALIRALDKTGVEAPLPR